VGVRAFGEDAPAADLNQTFKVTNKGVVVREECNMATACIKKQYEVLYDAVSKKDYEQDFIDTEITDDAEFAATKASIINSFPTVESARAYADKYVREKPEGSDVDSGGAPVNWKWLLGGVGAGVAVLGTFYFLASRSATKETA
jgi:hypothetical protein